MSESETPTSQRRVVTLLLSDVVDSTKLTEQLGEQRTAELWASHDHLARKLLAQHGGREIDKSDGFLLLFQEPGPAVEFVRAYHTALGKLEPPLAARAGLHVSEVHLRENPVEAVARGAKPIEVDGLGKSVAARVMSLAVGGQTLASSEAVRALGLDRVSAPPDGRLATDDLIALSHGYWRLKGVNDPVELLEVGRRGEAPMIPPPDSEKAWRVTWRNDAWVPVNEVRHHLPRERDAFVGRAAELQQLATMLDGGASLVTVLGIGGTGKTRLVIHYGWTWLGGWPGGVWFCDLSEARGEEGMAYAVASAMDVPLGQGDPIAQLTHAIAGRGRCLVILDNFEHVASHARSTLGRWLDGASEAQFVVTTREVLALPGETVLGLMPLDVDEATALFDARARQAKASYSPDPASVEQLVRLIDQLPLAIELAAARVRTMSPRKVLERIGDRFRMLSSPGRRDRHAALRATLDWSWELLSDEEQSALAQLSVFESGFTLEAAEAVLSLDNLWAADAVQSLVDKSLVQHKHEDRLTLLISVKEYASGQLDAQGDPDTTRDRHCAAYAAWGADDVLDALDGPGGSERWWTLAEDLDNIVTACRRAIRRADPTTAVGTLRAAWAVLKRRGPPGFAADLAGDVLRTPGLDALDLGYAHWVAGQAKWFAGELEDADTLHRTALAILRERGRPDLEAQVHSNLGVIAQIRGRMDLAHQHYEDALERSQHTSSRVVRGGALGNFASLHHAQGRMEEAERCYREALAIHREVQNRREEANVLGNLALALQAQGRISEAGPLCREALQLHREVGNRRHEANELLNLGNLA